MRIIDRLQQAIYSRAPSNLVAILTPEDATDLMIQARGIDALEPWEGLDRKIIDGRSVTFVVERSARDSYVIATAYDDTGPIIERL